MQDSRLGWIVFLAFGFLMFSTSGELLLKEKIGFSYNIQEVWLFLFLPFMRQSHLKNLVHELFSPFFLLLLSIWWILVALALFQGYPLYDIARSARPAFYILALSFYFFKHPQDLSIHSLYWLCIGAIFGDIYSSLETMGERSIVWGGHDEYQHGMNITAVFIATACAIISQRKLLIMPTYFISVALILLSSFRINMISLLAATGFSLFYVYLKIKGNYRKLFFLLKVIPIIIIGSLCYYIAMLNLKGSYMSYRLIERSLLFITQGASVSQDDRRISVASRYLNGLDVQQMLPQGFITVAKDLISFHYDYPFAYMFDTFGTLMSVVIIFILAINIIFIVLGLRKSNERDASTVGSLYLLFFPLLILLNGRVFYVVSESMLCGVVLGLSIYMAKRSFSIRFNGWAKSDATHGLSQSRY